jgi:hypothetical protein
MHYDTWERRLAKALDGFPRLRAGLKWGYQRLCYYRHRRPEALVLHPQAVMTPVLPLNEPGRREGFFGYFDLTPWDPTDRWHLLHIYEGGPRLRLAAWDTLTGEFRYLGGSEAFNFQQGARLGWLPGGEDLVVYNDREQGRLVARIVHALTGEVAQVLDWPVQVVHPGGTEALTLNYRRLHRLGSEYGYAGAARNFPDTLRDDQDGIWRLDVRANRAELLISLGELQHRDPQPSMADSRHKVNHLLYNPTGARFAFMHRWLGPRGKFSRLYTADSRTGGDLQCLLDERLVSHYAWQDEEHLLVWARKAPWGDRYLLLRDRSSQAEVVGDGVLDSYGDGHPAFSPDRRRFITDTYPDKGRMRHLLLYDRETGRLTEVGRFFAPWAYEDARRCDLHPRWNRAGTRISVDSAHEGRRNTYIIDIAEIIK